VAILVA
ncbi:hypothetical protein VN97_g10668, partial [Penicillium thymicola]